MISEFDTSNGDSQMTSFKKSKLVLRPHEKESFVLEVIPKHRIFTIRNDHFQPAIVLAQLANPPADSFLNYMQFIPFMYRGVICNSEKGTRRHTTETLDRDIQLIKRDMLKHIRIY